jgi:hypothetical protein
MLFVPLALLALLATACSARPESDSDGAQASSLSSSNAPNVGSHTAPTLYCSHSDACDPTDDCAGATAEVNAAFNNNLVGLFSGGAGFEFDYCIAGRLECRSLLLQNTTGAPTAFVDNFTASRRFVSSAGYFLPNADGTYKAYLDQTWDGNVNVDLAWQDNQHLNVTWDCNGLPTMHNLILKRLGTTKYVIADLTYALDKATIIGTMYDESDPTFSQAYNSTYVRVTP